MNILVTGGAGYIGSHTIVELIANNFKVVAIDNFSNSSPNVFDRLKSITGHDVPFVSLDLRNKKELDTIFKKFSFDAVIHFAGLKSVGESVNNPLMYYSNNVDSTLSLLDVMQANQVKKLVFSSSATVYGEPEMLPLEEANRTGIGITNPYGHTKFMIEQILKDVSRSNDEWEITLLRYFNPVGAHKSGLIGEDPKSTPNNLLPYISQVAVGKLEKVNVFGNDYETPDGTGIRDYIHVVDIANGHIAAINHLTKGTSIYNLGTGKGTSVLELIRAFSTAANIEIPYQITDRRPGDIAACYASSKKANKYLGWKAEITIEQACEDSWRWQSQNPNGFN